MLTSWLATAAMVVHAQPAARRLPLPEFTMHDATAAGVLVLTTGLSFAQASALATPVLAVVSADGSSVSGATLLAGERRVVIYVAPALEPAARLIEALRRWSESDPERWRSRVSVIVAAPPMEARAWLATHWGERELPLWFADPDASAWRALGFQGTLGIAGAANGVVEWKIDGVIDDPAVVEPAVRTWTEGAK